MHGIPGRGRNEENRTPISGYSVYNVHEFLGIRYMARVVSSLLVSVHMIPRTITAVSLSSAVAVTLHL